MPGVFATAVIGSMTPSSSDRWPPQLFVADLLLSSAFLTAGFFWVKTPDMTPKRLAWLLSAFSSFITASLSMSALYQLFAQSWVIENVLFADDRLSRFTATFFIAFLILDLALGMRYYPSQIHLLSGWVHHCFYLGVLAWALHSHFSLGFCLFLPLEIPTFILAVGSIYPQRRSDWLFGMTFFITRICYHLWLFVLVREIKDPRLPVWVVIAVTFCLHIYWFGLWWKSYRRKYLLGKGGKKEGAMEGKGVAAAAGEQGNEDGGRKSKKE
ncbi:hypothetical protein NSK_006503 [Nannochloropsis salina CCMP1776]|uniref:TLC domain-containing protein n=1 Tax=Nannochloropsis salina CCMP1776 TaxID=1027361 RepID=A0A4D9CUA5_9STRA|nr:hypothetical protein NSK_006503 [Nannochloropsis salina CCMP1776]|eukprot:TFJ82174.1 hypothetical protein NSK_006503 [Nannochloropsis salina CCMP1776]